MRHRIGQVFQPRDVQDGAAGKILGKAVTIQVYPDLYRVSAYKNLDFSTFSRVAASAVQFNGGVSALFGDVQVLFHALRPNHCGYTAKHYVLCGELS